MYIHFDLPCGRQMQKRLHTKFRYQIKEWERLGIVNRAVLTFHYSHPPEPSDSLYLCLDIPAVEKKNEQKVELSREELKQIPSLVMVHIRETCHENRIKPRITDFKVETEQAKRSKEQRGEDYYDGAPIKHVLRFASVGTKIAFEVLDHLEINKEIWRSDIELSRFIFLRLKDELGTDYEWMDWALHFVCNPLLVPEGFIVSPRLRRAVETILIDP